MAREGREGVDASGGHLQGMSWKDSKPSPMVSFQGNPLPVHSHLALYRKVLPSHHFQMVVFRLVSI